jgi:pilus assembly protein Flp/PilA
MKKVMRLVVRVVLRQRRIIIERKAIMLFAPKEKGQGLVEYAIILALIAIVVIAVMRLLGPKIGNTFSTISNSLP